MKILQVIPYFNPKFGGDVNMCNNLSIQLAKRNHQVTIITTDYCFDLEYSEKIRSEGVTVIPIPCIAKWGLFLYSPSLINWIEKNLRSYDIIHLHNYRSYQNVAVHIYAMKFGIPYIVQAHGSVLPFFEKQTLKKFYDFVWGNKILKDSSKLIAVSKVEKIQYIKMGVPEHKIEIVPNGIDLSQYKSLPEYGRFRKKYGISSVQKMILYLGRLHKRKGLDFLINSFSTLLSLNKNVTLIIAGSDDGFFDILMKLIKKLKIEDKIIFTGSISENEKKEAYVDADVLVYPGVLEIFGLVPFEAMMCGTSVIVSDDCGCGEVIRESHCGYLVQYGDISDLNKKILKIFEDSGLNKKMVDLGRRYIQENLAWVNVVELIIVLYENVRMHRENTITRLVNQNVKNSNENDSILYQTTYFNIHDIITFSVEGSNKKIINNLEKFFDVFKTTEPIDTDIKIVISKFIPELDNCTQIGSNCYIKENYLYCKDGYKFIKWNLCIKNLFQKSIIYFNGSNFSDIIFREHILEPLLCYKLGQKGLVLLHASSISIDNKGYVFTGHPHVGKTSIILRYSQKNTLFLSDELAIISDKGLIYSYPTPLHIFNYNLKDNNLFYQKLEVNEKIMLKIKYIIRKLSMCYISFPQYIPAEIFFQNICATNTSLDYLIILSRTKKGDNKPIKITEKNQFVKELIQINKRQFKIFNHYLIAYSKLNPESDIGSYWNMMESNLLKSINRTKCCELQISLNADYTIFKEIDKSLDEMEVV